MEEHVIAAELSATGAQELLAATSSAHLAYNGENGTPRVIPVGFFWTGTEFVVSTATTSPKVAALKARPDVALSIDGGDTPEQVRALSVRVRCTTRWPASRSCRAGCASTTSARAACRGF
jgi:nitroimidazol reductase NimA-like FMN-containing flavoprotein (pyridoxamine 5'-phosphate oxidase superfamily)